MIFFRRTEQKPLTTNSNPNTSLSTIPPIKFDTVNLNDANDDDDENESPITPTPFSSNEKTKKFSNNCLLKMSTSTNEHLSEKHPGLLRLFDSTVWYNFYCYFLFIQYKRTYCSTISWTKIIRIFT